MRMQPGPENPKNGEEENACPCYQQIAGNATHGAHSVRWITKRAENASCFRDAQWVSSMARLTPAIFLHVLFFTSFTTPQFLRGTVRPIP